MATGSSVGGYWQSSTPAKDVAGEQHHRDGGSSVTLATRAAPGDESGGQGLGSIRQLAIAVTTDRR